MVRVCADNPFIDGAVGTVLDFAEVVSDGLLYDDGADGLKTARNIYAALVTERARVFGGWLVRVGTSPLRPHSDSSR